MNDDCDLSDEDRAAFLAMFRYSFAPAAAPVLVRTGRETNGVLASMLDEVAQDPGDGYTHVVGVLMRAIRHRSAKVRRAVAATLERALAALLASISRAAPEELEPVVAVLVEATAEADHATRMSALAALAAVAGRCRPTAVVAALAANTLADTRPDIVHRSVDVLLEVGPDAASAAVPAVAQLLSHADEAVRRRACRMLAWLQGDARTAVPALLDVALHEAAYSLRREAAVTLAEVDADGVVIGRTIADRVTQAALVELLRDVGAEVRALRRALQDQWEAATRGGEQVPSTFGHEAAPAGARHSKDFRSVFWFGTTYSFTTCQAAVIQVLWEHWEQRTPDVSGVTLVAAAGTTGGELRYLFRGHEAWGTMIVPGKTKGTYRLNEPRAK